jgi:hypothetical protein
MRQPAPRLTRFKNFHLPANAFLAVTEEVIQPSRLATGSKVRIIRNINLILRVAQCS